METDRIKKALTFVSGDNKAGDPKRSGWSIVRIIVTALVVIGLAWFVFTAVRDLIIYGLYFRYIDELAAKTGLNKYLINVLAAVGIAPFVLGFRYYFFSLKKSKRTQGAALLLGMIVVYNTALYVATKDNVIGRFYAITPEGVKFSDRALDDGREWQKVKRDNMWYVTHLAVGKRVDATDHDWFDQKSGLPLLWYSKLDNEIQFYDGPGYDRFTAEPLRPVTKELYLEWKRSVQSRTPPPASSPQSVAEALAEFSRRGTTTVVVDAPVGKWSEEIVVPIGFDFDWGESEGSFLVENEKGVHARFDPSNNLFENLPWIKGKEPGFSKKLRFKSLTDKPAKVNLRFTRQSGL